jgi:uncharacterized protein
MYQACEAKSKKINPFMVNGVYDDFNYLRDNFFLVKNQEIVRNMVREQYRLAISPENLSVTFMPVDQACNFRCVYCYEDHSKNKFMDNDDFDIFCKFISKQKISTLRVDYFGGEPLLNISFIKKCNSRLIEIGKEQGFVLTPSSMTTNGYLLTRKNFLMLHDLRITSYQVTVDGDRDSHNRLRPLVNGRGTYDVVYRNLLDMASTNKKFSLTLRTNFTPKNGAEEKRHEFLRKIENDFKGDKRFILMPEPIGKWSDGEKHNYDIHCSKKLASKLRDDFQFEAEAMGLETLSMVLLCGPESHFCYAGKPNNMIIYPLNEAGCLPLQKCTLEISRSSNNVGHISAEGELIKNEYWDSWVPNNIFVAKKCRNCFFVLNCFGNACVHKNQMRQKIICPKERRQEEILVPRILEYIARNQ